MYFVGIDLAWSTKNGTGLAIIEGNKKEAKVLYSDVVLTDEEIIRHIQEKVKDKKAFIAIDAPLIVPNEEGRRVAEAVVGQLFRKYHAGAHPSNRKRLSQWSGTIRGEELVKKLTAIGFDHNPSIEKFEATRKCFEVYPHPSMVVLFNLKKILQYKSKPKRDHVFLCGMFNQYQKHLRALKKSTPAFHVPEIMLRQDVTKIKGKALKRYEDKLDAIFCAYISYYAWSQPEKCAVLGSMEEGYILTPIFDHMKEQLRTTQAALTEF
ncbi:MAG TPA: DUF429 domain-containing protein [Candidatus Nanoarchaeia archaeon]|nr:DUF429 domain-containing protein [Candidatus Nanoarchaeia archaeon]